MLIVFNKYYTLAPNQVLKAKEINLNLRGFGISFARGLDVDNNDYPDIIVGAHNSNTAVVLRSHPVVNYQGDISFDTDGVNAYKSEFTMTVKIRYQLCQSLLIFNIFCQKKTTN